MDLATTVGTAIRPAGFNEYGPLKRVAVCTPADSYLDQATCDRRWQDELFLGKPSYASAVAEHEGLVAALRAAGAEVDVLPKGEATGMNAIYCRDSSIVAPEGIILGRMANPPRVGEPDHVEKLYRDRGLPIAGRIDGEGLLEGGDFVWFDEQTCAVAYGCRTNRDGIRQLKALLGPEVHVEVVGLPYWEGPESCLHLMSFISPVAEDLAVVYPRMMPVPFRDFLLDRGIRFIEVPDEEYDPSMGCNVLAVAPRECILLDGNPVTKQRMEAAGCQVTVCKGEDMSVKGGGGPTCLTRPLIRG